MLRYIEHVINGDFKDDTIFCGLVEAMVIGKERQMQGKGMQNFKYLAEYDQFMHSMHDLSPRAYRTFSAQFKARTECSIR